MLEKRSRLELVGSLERIPDGEHVRSVALCGDSPERLKCAVNCWSLEGFLRNSPKC